MNVNDAMISRMEILRDDGWCVVLKCLPRELSFIIEGSRSEYDAPCPDRKFGKGMWCCELSDMTYLRKGKHKFRGSPFGMGKTPSEAVGKAFDIAFGNKP